MSQLDSPRIKVGCCGFRRGRAEYYPHYSAVEVQHTFYQPPSAATLRGWREEAPPGFEFTLKAWQLITHAASSPTYRRLSRELAPHEKPGLGYFQPSEIVREGWAVTQESAAALGAAFVLFQCPARFKPTPENVHNLQTFIRSLDRTGLRLGWEPRGGWPLDLVRDLCEELELWHVVDPFETETTTPDRCYFRLHGRGGWRYQYDDSELQDLLALLPEDGPAYVFFNNAYMMQDALRFRERAGI